MPTPNKEPVTKLLRARLHIARAEVPLNSHLVADMSANVPDTHIEGHGDNRSTHERIKAEQRQGVRRRRACQVNARGLIPIGQPSTCGNRDEANREHASTNQ